MNGAVELGCRNILAFMYIGEGKVSPNAASSLGLREIRGVAADVEDHAASGIPNSRVRMGSNIIKYLCHPFGGGIGSFRLLQS